MVFIRDEVERHIIVTFLYDKLNKKNLFTPGVWALNSKCMRCINSENIEPELTNTHASFLFVLRFVFPFFSKNIAAVIVIAAVATAISNTMNMWAHSWHSYVMICFWMLTCFYCSQWKFNKKNRINIIENWFSFDWMRGQNLLWASSCMMWNVSASKRYHSGAVAESEFEYSNHK